MLLTGATVKQMMEIDPRTMTIIAKKSGYEGCTFELTDFTGLNDDREFVYRATYTFKERKFSGLVNVNCDTGGMYVNLGVY
jgi:hypothetical protein